MTDRKRDASPETMEDRRAILRARGVPEAFIDSIASRREGIGMLGNGALFFIPFLLTLGAAWMAMQLIAAHAWTLADASTASDAAWFSVVDGGFVGGMALVCLVFVGILGAGWLHSFATMRVKPFPAPNANASMLRSAVNGAAASLSDRKMRRVIARAAGEASADAFLRAIGSAELRFWRRATLVLLLPCAAAIALTHADHRTVGPSGVTLHSWWTTELVPWSDAKALTTGCNSTKDDEDFLYYVDFPRHRFDLADDGGFNFDRPEIAPEILLNAVEKIDALLPALPRKRWEWLGRNPMAPRCLSYWFYVAGGDTERVLNLLRVD